MSKAIYGSLVPLVSQADKGEAVSEFLLGGYALVQSEPDTLQWYALRLEGTQPAVYDIFDAFPSQEGRKAHFDGRIPSALMEHGPSLLSVGPDINKIMVDILASGVRKIGTGQRAGLSVGFRALFTAKPEKGAAVRDFLLNALPEIEEKGTAAWYALQYAGSDNFGIVGFFAIGEAREAHLKGLVASMLFSEAEEMLTDPPTIARYEVLAAHVTTG